MINQDPERVRKLISNMAEEGLTLRDMAQRLNVSYPTFINQVRSLGLAGVSKKRHVLHQVTGAQWYHTPAVEIGRRLGVSAGVVSNFRRYHGNEIELKIRNYLGELDATGVPAIMDREHRDDLWGSKAPVSPWKKRHLYSSDDEGVD